MNFIDKKLFSWNSKLPKDGHWQGPCVYILGKNSQVPALCKKLVPSAIQKKITDPQTHFYSYESEAGLSFFVLPKKIEKSKRSQFEGTADYPLFRDILGEKTKLWSSHKSVNLIFLDCSQEAIKGALVGIQMAHYSYKKVTAQSEDVASYQVFNPKGGKDAKKQLAEAHTLATSANYSRHLVNTPPNKLYPDSYAQLCQKIFSKFPNTTVSIWDDKKLEKENMNLMMAVGKASEFKPRLVHIKYRPKSSKKPIAFVGKGVTFDSGGLNLKPGQYMRWMKKDMGGSASVFGLAHWLTASAAVKRPFDFYLGLVENSVASNAFRPSDIITSRNGITVEIDNTDAEGRLVMADVLDVAVSQKGKDKPEVVMDMATLTGASRVALGYDVGGMYSTDEKLARKIEKHSFAMGDPVWLMPLVPHYIKALHSTFADTANSGAGMGGAITAALFLQKFVKDVPWVHFDINAWTDSLRGGFAEKGGNGQLVQAMSSFLKSI